MKFRVLFLAAALAFAATAQAQEYHGFIKFEPNVPAGQKREGNDKEWYYVNYKSARDPKVMSGLWEAAGPHHVVRKNLDHTELMHILHGSFTLMDNNDGRTEIFKAGDTVLVPRGTSYTWDQKSGTVRKYWAVFDPVPAVKSTKAQTSDKSPTFMRLEADGPGGVGLKPGRQNTKGYTYFKGEDGSSVGVWESAPTEDYGNFNKSEYAELMIFLTGSPRLVHSDGTEEHFHAGDVVLVPYGVPHKWRSDTARKFYAYFDVAQPRAVSAASANAEKKTSR
jgi:uncharacterized cupin superfamily protein